MEERNVQEQDGYGAFPVILKIIAVLCIFTAIVSLVAIKDGETAIIVVASGIVSFVWWWALSIIVAACSKYLKSGNSDRDKKGTPRSTTGSNTTNDQRAASMLEPK